MALDFYCVSVLPGQWSSRTLGEAAAWRQPGIHRACVPSRGMAVQPSLLVALPSRKLHASQLG